MFYAKYPVSQLQFKADIDRTFLGDGELGKSGDQSGLEIQSRPTGKGREKRQDDQGVLCVWVGDDENG
jgi:hypothetical protein